jgi:CPA1 family monovalent cation:H+ antiporter
VNDTYYAITVFVTLLLVASGVAMAAKYVRVPYTLMLVIVGLIISPMHFLPPVHISPDLILLIFLPALLFEAAWNLKLNHLRKNLLPILMLAVVGVLLSVGVIGAVLHFGIALPWRLSLLLGAMISATDPVSVLALFKKLNLPGRIATIVEGESLLNDGTAVVVFRILLGIAVGSVTDSTGDLIWSSLREFGLVVFGGLAVGAGVGIIASWLTSYFDDHLLEITLTTIAAYGSFLLAEGMHVSPVIAILIAGLIIGNYGRRVGMSPTTQVSVNAFWEYAAFVVNSLVFLLIGLEMQVGMLIDNFWSIAWAVLAMFAARAVAIYGLIPLTNRLSEPISARWQTIFFWGGLRGSLSIALVLSLPTTLAGRPQLIVMTFGAVIISLLLQGLTIGPLLRKLKLIQASPGIKESEALQGQFMVETAAKAELDSLRKQGIITERVHQRVAEMMKQSQDELRVRMAQLDVTDQTLEQQQLQRLHRHLINIKKARLTELLREGMLSESAYTEITERLNQDFAETENTFFDLEQPDRGWSSSTPPASETK